MVADILVNFKSPKAGLYRYKRQTAPDSFQIKVTTTLI